MAVMFLGTRFQSFKNDGTVNNGGTVEFYETDGSTHKDTYSDSGLTVANTWPVTLNSAGAADIWYDGNANVTVKDSTGTIIDSFTDINPTEIDTSTAPNIVPNGSFEDLSGTNPTYWVQTLYSSGTGTQDADSIHGKYSWKFTSAGSGGGYITSEVPFLVAYNRPIVLYWDMKSSVADVRNVVDILWYDDTDSLLSTTTAYDNSTTNPTTYTRKYYTATPPINAVTAKLRLYGCHSSDSTSGDTFYDNLNVLDAGFLGAPLTFGSSLWFSEGASVASAATIDIWTTDGNTIHITGSTGPVTSFATAPQAGAVKWLIFDSTPTITHSSNLNLPGSADITVAAGDVFRVYADTTTQMDIQYFPVAVNPKTLSGAVVATAALRTSNTSVANTAFVQQEIGASGGTASVGVGTLKFGTINISQNATQYLSALGTTSHGTEALAEYYVNDNIRLSTLYVSASALAPAGQTCVITVRKNSVDTSIMATITDAVQNTSDLINTVDLVPGDRFSVKAVTSATFGSTNDIKVSLVAKIAGTNIGAGLLLLNSVGATTPVASGEAQVSTTSMVTGLHLPVPTCSIGHDYAQTGTVSINKNSTTYAVGSSSPFTGTMDFVCEAGDYIYFPTAGADAAGAISFRPTRMRHLSIPGLIAFASWNQTQNTTVYAGGWTVSTSSTTEADVSLPISAGTIKNLRVALDSAPAAGNTCIVTVRKNGVDTALTVTIDDTETIDADTSNTVSFSAGDKLSISVTLSATSGSRYIGITVEHVTA